jgi:hypothetical protein
MSEVFCSTELTYIKGAATGPVPVDILNGRHFDNPGWETCGFELKEHHSSVSDWSSAEQIQQIHYDEISSFARELTGCRHALVGGHILRNPEQVKIHPQLGPIAFVHSDFTDNYGDLMREYYSADDEESRVGLTKSGITAAEVKAARRMLILQFWRNVGPQKMDLPLAFCDARTVPRADMQSIPVNNYAGGDFSFDAFGVNEPLGHSHEWYVYPEMNVDEVVVFRTFDSQQIERGAPFWTPHSAFQDPEVKIGSPSRYSIELRATCLFY